MEANEMIGIHEDEEMDFVSDSEDSQTDSDDAMHDQMGMLHKSRMSQTRMSEKLDFVMDDDSNLLGVPAGTEEASRKPGRMTMAGQAMEQFISSGNQQKAVFHRKRASSIVQRIMEKSGPELKDWSIKGRKSRRSLSRKSMSMLSAMDASGAGAGGGRHSRAFSSGHFVTQFFKNATDRQKIEAGMRGEAPLIIYYCDKDEMTDQIKDIYQVSVLDVYMDDYNMFDDYIKILSMRLEHAQKKHRTEMDELRRHKEDLTNEVDALRTKKEELIRLIGQERSLFKRELPLLADTRRDANAAQDQYDAAEAVIKDKFNETKLHVMMMMQFRDNHLLKLNEHNALTADIKAKIQTLQGEIEELLSYYFTLQNAHNKLEHTVALLSELTTLCHEVNVRKKAEYEREIKDLLAMIERYRCRIRNVDRLIEEYQKEVVELRMLYERRSAEFKKIQKNPTTNRTAATIDYYVAQRKLYEQKAERQADTFDDFLSVQQKYTKELKNKSTSLRHYEDRSNIADKKYKAAIRKQQSLLFKCRDLCKSLGMSWKQAQQEWVEHGNPLSKEFHDQLETMKQFEAKSKPHGFEFVDPPPASNKQEILSAFDGVLVQKTHDQIQQEEKYLDQGQLDRTTVDVITAGDLPQYAKVPAQAVYGDATKVSAMAQDPAAVPMAILHRGDPNLDMFRAPTNQSMEPHPDVIIQRTQQAVNELFEDTYGRPPRPLDQHMAGHDDRHDEDEDDDDDDDDVGYDDAPRMKATASNQSKASRQSGKRGSKKSTPRKQAGVQKQRSVHFKDSALQAQMQSEQ